MASAKIIMLQTQYGSQNGYDGKYYLKGRHYEVSDFLLESFLRMGVAKILNDEWQASFEVPEEPQRETKIIEPKRRGRPKKNG